MKKSFFLKYQLKQVKGDLYAEKRLHIFYDCQRSGFARFIGMMRGLYSPRRKDVYNSKGELYNSSYLSESYINDDGNLDHNDELTCNMLSNVTSDYKKVKISIFCYRTDKKYPMTATELSFERGFKERGLEI